MLGLSGEAEEGGAGVSDIAGHPYGRSDWDARGILGAFAICGGAFAFIVGLGIAIAVAFDGAIGAGEDHTEAAMGAALAIGVGAVFMETHQDPDNAPSDGPNMVPLKQLPGILETLVEIDRIAKAKPVSI